MRGAPSAVCVRRGEVVVHVNEASLLPQVVASLSTVQPEMRADTVVILASAADVLLQHASACAPERKFRSLRDVLYFFLEQLSAQDSKMLQLVNASYSLLRHMSHCEILNRCNRIAAELVVEPLEAGQGGAAPHHNSAPQADFTQDMQSQSGAF